MQFLDHNAIDRHQWQRYKQLELISDSVDNADTDRVSFRFGIDRAWRLLITLLLDELVAEQKVEYLDRCWALNDLDAGKRAPSKTLQRLLTLME